MLPALPWGRGTAMGAKVGVLSALRAVPPLPTPLLLGVLLALPPPPKVIAVHLSGGNAAVATTGGGLSHICSLQGGMFSQRCSRQKEGTINTATGARGTANVTPRCGCERSHSTAFGEGVLPTLARGTAAWMCLCRNANTDGAGLSIVLKTVG